MLIIASHLKLMFWETVLFSCPLNDFLRYFAFRERIIPWSIGWVFQVVFGGRNTSSTAFKPSIIRCAGELSAIRITLDFLLQTFNQVLLPIHQKGNCSSNFSLATGNDREAFDVFEASWFCRFTNDKYW